MPLFKLDEYEKKKKRKRKSTAPTPRRRINLNLLMAVQLMRSMGAGQVGRRPVISWEVAYTASIKSQAASK